MSYTFKNDDISLALFKKKGRDIGRLVYARA
jgi:hypothetical protein